MDVLLGTALVSVGHATIHGLFQGWTDGRLVFEDLIRGALTGAVGGGAVGLGIGLTGLLIVLVRRVRPSWTSWMLLNLSFLLAAVIFYMLGIIFIEYTLIFV
jgi:hypothetical protein